MSLAPDAVARIAAALDRDGVIAEPEQLRTYECDGLTGARVVPALVTLPRSTSEVQVIVRVCHEYAIPFVARGAGTGLSGGAVPHADGLVISLARMNRIVEIDLESGRVTVEPGVTNLAVTQAVAPHGFYYAPDPSSQQVCTIGGNVAENSGGAHCLKHGFTVTHVTGLEVVLPDGDVVYLGGKGLDNDDLDLMGVFIGSEGTLGIATRMTLRILRKPETVRTLLAGFDSTRQAGAAVSGVIATGILAGAMEIMDRLTLEAAEASVHPGYPDCGAVLIIELDGSAVQVEDDMTRVVELCRSCGATATRIAADDAERALFWKGRKAAFAAMGRVSHDYYVQDGVVPRTKLPEVLDRIGDLEREYGLRVGNVFHAGDGNLHPLVLYDRRNEGEPEKAKELAEAILEVCMDVGGSLTGEHGIGTDKACRMPLMFSETDLDVMQRLRQAFDPAGLCNPGKISPRPRLCGEVPGPYRAHPLELAGLAGVLIRPPVEAAARLLASASASGMTVSIERGGGDVVLRTRRLDRVIEHEAGDLTATVEAGILLSTLNARLARAGQMLALDPPGDPTIGACIAGNLSGPRRHRYGGPRDLVLGATLVLADGTVASAGGKVVKNVAGYDLGKLACGSRGRLGLLARVSLRLHPLPTATRTVAVTIDDLAEAYRLTQLVHFSSLVPSAVDVLWHGRGSQLAVMFEGSQRAVDAQFGAACELLGGDEADGSIWQNSREQQGAARGRLSFPPRGLVQTLTGVAEAVIRPAIGSAYIPGTVQPQTEVGARRLADHVRAAFDPDGILV